MCLHLPQLNPQQSDFHPIISLKVPLSKYKAVQKPISKEHSLNYYLNFEYSSEVNHSLLEILSSLNIHSSTLLVCLSSAVASFLPLWFLHYYYFCFQMIPSCSFLSPLINFIHIYLGDSYPFVGI